MPGGYPNFEKLLYLPRSERFDLLEQQIGTEALGQIIAAAILDIQSRFNVKRSMDNRQIALCAMRLVPLCCECHLTIQDLCVFTEMFCDLKLTAILDRLDEGTIRQALNKYLDMRWQVLQDIKTAQHNSYKQYDNTNYIKLIEDHITKQQQSESHRLEKIRQFNSRFTEKDET